MIMKTQNIERCYRTGIYTVFSHVRASFSPGIFTRCGSERVNGLFYFGLVYLVLDIKQAVLATQATEDTLAEFSQCRYPSLPKLSTQSFDADVL